jgi:hypothetical protein
MAQKRNGLNQMIKYVKLFCKVYVSYVAAAKLFIDSTDYTTGQKEAAKAALDAVNAACHDLLAFEVFYEK